MGRLSFLGHVWRGNAIKSRTNSLVKTFGLSSASSTSVMRITLTEPLMNMPSSQVRWAFPLGMKPLTSRIPSPNNSPFWDSAMSIFTASNSPLIGRILTWLTSLLSLFRGSVSTETTQDTTTKGKPMKFRPQSNNGRHKLKSNRKGFYTGQYNWHSYHDNDHGPVNERTLGRIFGRIHYLTSHAPEPVQKRWRQARTRWHKKMDRKAPVDYCNKYTLHRFL